MLKVHTCDGQTHDVDVRDQQSFRVWANRFKDPSFQARITGLSVVHKGVTYSLPRPVDFPDAKLAAGPLDGGKGGELLVLRADQFTVEMAVHSDQRAARVSIKSRS